MLEWSLKDIKIEEIKKAKNDEIKEKIKNSYTSERKKSKTIQDYKRKLSLLKEEVRNSNVSKSPKRLNSIDSSSKSRRIFFDEEIDFKKLNTNKNVNRNSIDFGNKVDRQISDYRFTEENRRGSIDEIVKRARKYSKDDSNISEISKYWKNVYVN